MAIRPSGVLCDRVPDLEIGGWLGWLGVLASSNLRCEKSDPEEEERDRKAGCAELSDRLVSCVNSCRAVGRCLGSSARHAVTASATSAGSSSGHLSTDTQTGPSDSSSEALLRQMSEPSQSGAASTAREASRLLSSGSVAPAFQSRNG